MTDAGPAKRRRGCFFYGCLAGVACLLTVVAALLLGVHQVRKMINIYTDTRPMTLPKVEMTKAQLDTLQQRVETFKEDLSAGRPTQPLALTGDDLNALLAVTPSASAFKGKLYVTITNNHLHGQVSLPMAQLGLSLFRGRYLNGSGTFAVALRNGILYVTAQQLDVKGKPLPAVYMDRIRQENLASGFNDNPRVSGDLKRLEDIKVEDGKLILVPKKP